MEMDKSQTAGEIATNPRASIDSQLKLIQEDLDGVEKRLKKIIEELLGPQTSPEPQVQKERTKAEGWLHRVTLRLGEFRDQLRRIKELEKNLRRSIIDSPASMLEEQKEPTEG